MPSHEIVSLMECAGNSRSTMQPPAEGVQWDNGGVSVSQWRGVSVKTVLEQASLKSVATDVLFEGLDSVTESHANGKLVYAMSVPVEKLLDPDTILAYEMNGEPLPKDHGYPIRLLVPSWYGMASVKWLAKITVMDHPNEGFHETDYRIYPATDGKSDATVQRVTKLRVKSLISAPTKGSIVSPGRHKINGVAGRETGTSPRWKSALTMPAPGMPPSWRSPTGPIPGNTGSTTGRQPAWGIHCYGVAPPIARATSNRCWPLGTTVAMRSTPSTPFQSQFVSPSPDSGLKYLEILRGGPDSGSKRLLRLFSSSIRPNRVVSLH